MEHSRNLPGKLPNQMKWKGKINPGSSTEEMILMMDFYPTLARFARAGFNQKIDGLDIWPVISGEQTALSIRPVFWMRREGWDYGGQIYYTARFQQFKLVQNTPFEDYQLFDLDNDPAENDPLPSTHDMFDRLKTKLREHIQQAGSIPWQKEK